jgi:hypothetical protein
MEDFVSKLKNLAKLINRHITVSSGGSVPADGCGSYGIGRHYLFDCKPALALIYSFCRSVA